MSYDLHHVCKQGLWQDRPLISVCYTQAKESDILLGRSNGCQQASQQTLCSFSLSNFVVFVQFHTGPKAVQSSCSLAAEAIDAASG